MTAWALQGTALDMVEDLNHAMGFVFANAQRWGGDPDHVFLCGQSCGGHLASLAVLTQVRLRQWVAASALDVANLSC